MKIKLAVSKDRYDEIKCVLTEHGIEVDEKADLVLSESGRFVDSLMVKDTGGGGRVLLPSEEIVSIEAYGHTIEVYTRDRTYQAFDRLYKVLGLLDPEKFLRVSNSVVIAKDKVKKITPALSMKFVLTMANGRRVDVTRSYYYIFKEAFGI